MCLESMVIANSLATAVLTVESTNENYSDNEPLKNIYNTKNRLHYPPFYENTQNEYKIQSWGRTYLNRNTYGQKTIKKIKWKTKT